MYCIETKMLCKSYGKARGIVDVNLKVEEGEIFGFIGPNGAGKSTTIRTLLSLIYPSSGSATIFGRDIKETKEILMDVGYLPSEVNYYDGMRVKDLLAYSASFYHKDCSKKIATLVARLQLDQNRKIDDLSYGNKKKVGIVQALLHSPKLIILDEPTSGLDPLIKQVFFDLMKEENACGATILFSSHVLSEVQQICDRVAIIKEGSIVAVEEVANLRKNSYKKVMVEFDVMPHDLIQENTKLVSQSANQARFLYQGDINDLLKRLAMHPLRNLSIEDPELEEIFLHYYE